jgi:NTE family protein
MPLRTPQPTARGLPAAAQHAQMVLVLQGGGALGAYQAGAFEAAAAAGALPDWVAGVSIGAINAALIAGNPPQRRVARLRAFWERVSAVAPFVAPAPWAALRPALNRIAAATAMGCGVPGFFHPRLPHPQALSVYDTAPLRETLLELVDFDLLNRGGVRLSVGAVDIESGNSVYFDNATTTITPEHVMASGALPPGFAPVRIDERHYWDGGIVSNSPLWYVLDEAQARAQALDALILQIDLFSARGPLPNDLDQVQERAKDIQYSSKTRFNSTQMREREELKAALRRLLGRLPQALHDDPDVRRLELASREHSVSLVHLINRHDTGSASVKDYEFSRATVNDLWDAGLADMQQGIERVDWKQAVERREGMRVFDLTR